MQNITTPKSYTNKDFNSIYTELLDIVKQLSSKWDPTISTESDPGVILLKADAIIADKNNYNIDKNILEVFPQTVTQDINARNIYKQMGYNMPWYRSGTGEQGFKWIGRDLTVGETVTIPKFTMFTDAENNYVYTSTEDVTLSGDKLTGTCPIVEGTIVELKVNGSAVIKYDCVDDNNRIYLPDYIVAQNGLFIYNVGEEGEYWDQVGNLYVQPLGKKLYEFCVDIRNSSCYIQFPEDVSELIGEGLHIKYILSSGANGNVSAGEITTFYQDVEVQVGNESIVLGPDNLVLNNLYAITDGSDPESLTEAYTNYQRTVGTFNTLVTVRDYINAILQTDKVSNGFVTDRLTDPQCSYYVITDDDVNSLQLYVTGVEKLKATPDPEGKITFEDKKYTVETYTEPDMSAFDLKLYLLHKPNSVDDGDGYDKSFEMISDGSRTMSEIVTSMNDNKCVQHNFVDKLNNRPHMFINTYPLYIKILPHHRLTSVETASVKQNIVKSLMKKYNSANVVFGEEPEYNDVVESIESADPRIKAVVLKELSYVTHYWYYNENVNKYELRELMGPNSAGVRQEIVARSVLKGVTPWFIRDSQNDTRVSDVYLAEATAERVSTHLLVSPFAYNAEYHDDGDGSIKIPVQGSTDPIDTHLSVVTGSNSKSGTYTLKKNESIRCFGPSFVTDQNYSNYVKYQLVLNSEGSITYEPTLYNPKQHQNTSSIEFLISKEDTFKSIRSYTEPYSFTFIDSEKNPVEVTSALSSAEEIAVYDKDNKTYKSKYYYNTDGDRSTSGSDAYKGIASSIEANNKEDLINAISYFEKYLKESSTKYTLSVYLDGVEYYVYPYYSGSTYTLRLGTSIENTCHWSLVYYETTTDSKFYGLVWTKSVGNFDVVYIGRNQNAITLTDSIQDRISLSINRCYRATETSEEDAEGNTITTVSFDNASHCYLREQQINKYGIASGDQSPSDYDEKYTKFDVMMELVLNDKGSLTVSKTTESVHPYMRFLYCVGASSINWDDDSSLDDILLENSVVQNELKKVTGKVAYTVGVDSVIPTIGSEIDDGESRVTVTEAYIRDKDNGYLYTYLPADQEPLNTIKRVAWQNGYITLYRINKIRELPANSDYQLQNGDSIIFFWREEEGDNSPYMYRKYTGNTDTTAYVVRPTFRLQANSPDDFMVNPADFTSERGQIQCGERWYKEISNLYGENDLSGTKEIEMRKLNHLFFDAKDKYYFISSYITQTDAGNGQVINNYSMTFDKIGTPTEVSNGNDTEYIGTYFHILEEDEAFIRCYKSNTGYEILRAGTLVGFKKKFTSPDIPPTIPLEVVKLSDDLSMSSSESITELYENSEAIGDGSEFFYREQQIYNMVEGDTITVMRDNVGTGSLPPVEFNSWSNYVVPTGVRISYTPVTSDTATELPMIRVNDNISSWIIRASLNLNTAPSIAQKITPIVVDSKSSDRYKSLQFFLYKEIDIQDAMDKYKETGAADEDAAEYCPEDANNWNTLHPAFKARAIEWYKNSGYYLASSGWTVANNFLFDYLLEMKKLDLNNSHETLSVDDLVSSMYITTNIDILKVGGSNIDVSYLNLMNERLDPEFYIYTNMDKYLYDPYTINNDGSVTIDFDKWPETEDIDRNSDEEWDWYNLPYVRLMENKKYLIAYDTSKLKYKDGTSVDDRNFILRYANSGSAEDPFQNTEVSSKYSILTVGTYNNGLIHIGVSQGGVLSGKLTIYPLIRFNYNSGIFGDDKSFNEPGTGDSKFFDYLRELDHQSLFKYNYEVPSDVEILDPLDPRSFFDENHIHNKHTISKAHFYQKENKADVFSMITIIGNR